MLLANEDTLAFLFGEFVGGLSISGAAVDAFRRRHDRQNNDVNCNC